MGRIGKDFICLNEKGLIVDKSEIYYVVQDVQASGASEWLKQTL